MTKKASAKRDSGFLSWFRAHFQSFKDMAGMARTASAIRRTKRVVEKKSEIHDRIEDLRKEFFDPSSDAQRKADINKEIDGLLARRNELRF
jgi:hypothetical protein